MHLFYHCLHIVIFRSLSNTEENVNIDVVHLRVSNDQLVNNKADSNLAASTSFHFSAF